MDLAVDLPNYSSNIIEPVSRDTQNYRKYPDAVKDAVAKTKNIYLFPELKIPRTTAQYPDRWISRINRIHFPKISFSKFSCSVFRA